MNTAALTGNSNFLQQPTFVPAPGQTLSAATMAQQPAAAMGGFAQQPLHAPMYGPFTQQQYTQYQQQPQLYHQHQQQQQLHQQQLQLQLLQQQQQQQQQQQALQYQQMPTSQHYLQQQAQQLQLNHSNSGGSHHGMQRILSSGSQRGSPAGQSGMTEFGLTPHDATQNGRLMAVPSHGSLHEAGQEAVQQRMGQQPSQTVGAGQPGNMAEAGQVPNQASGSSQAIRQSPSPSAGGTESKAIE